MLILEIIRDVVLIVTGVVGSIFAIYQFKKNREAEPILQLELTLNVHNVSGKNLVDAAIQIKNIGKVAVYVTPEGTRRALFMVRKVSCPENPVHLLWEQFENDRLIGDVEYMNVYESYYPDEPLIFEPNSVDIYNVFFSTNYDGPIWVRVELIDKDDYKWLVNRLVMLPKPQTA